MFQLPLEMQAKVASYMKLESESECNVGSKKYQILPTNDDETLLTSSLSTHSLGEWFYAFPVFLGIPSTLILQIITKTVK